MGEWISSMEVMEMINKSFWKDKKVLITGHTGFKGSWLSIWLNLLGAKVSGIALPPESSPSLFNQLQLSDLLEANFYVDIRDKLFLKEKIFELKPEIVFHMAAQPLVRKSYLNPIETWEVNVMGSLNLLKILTELDSPCAVVMVTTDKVYRNEEWVFGYREEDHLGGFDPYSSSKAACEIAISSWRSSFCRNFKNKPANLFIASARSGNVIGGGDWAEDRIIPDVVKALNNNSKVLVRNPNSTRPWQHVLEPLSGYIVLAEMIFKSKEKYTKNDNPYCAAFNFGPSISANKTVSDLVNEIFKYWSGECEINIDDKNLHEAVKLNLQVDKSYQLLNWSSRWDFEITVERTIKWYKSFKQKYATAYI